MAEGDEARAHTRLDLPSSPDIQHLTPDTCAERISLVRELSNELAAYFYTLPDDVWRNADQYASACEKWKVADVVTHLVQWAQGYAMSIARALRGDASPPMGHRQQSDEEALSSLVALRTAYYEDLFPEFNTSCRQLNTLLASLKPEDYGRPAWHPFGVVPISRLIDYRVMELAVHGWDIRYCFERAARLSPKAVPFLKGWIWQWLRWGFQRSGPLASPIRYRFALKGGSEGYDVVISGDDFHLLPSDEVEADVTFRCDDDTCILFCMGRLPLPRAARRGQISFEGDGELAARFSQWFSPL